MAPAPVASTDIATPTTQAVDGAEPIAVAAADDGSMPDGGPRKVKTMVVRPDGSVMAPPERGCRRGSRSCRGCAPGCCCRSSRAAAAPSRCAAAAEARRKRSPLCRPRRRRGQAQAAAKPAADRCGSAGRRGPTKYVVQVGSKKNQTDALASFADMQQKYPSLLANYRPMVQKADLGAKGVWYRLRIGPIADKTAASKLCTQLKSQGLPDCLVMAQ